MKIVEIKFKIDAQKSELLIQEETGQKNYEINRELNLQNLKCNHDNSPWHQRNT